MRVVVEIRDDSGAGQKIRLKTGETVRIGRTTRADFALPQDTYLSSLHFALTCEEDACRLTDLKSSNGTLVNGKQVSECALRDGDEIVAGRTTFAVHLESDAPANALPLVSRAEAQPVAMPSALPVAPVTEAAMSPYARRLLEILRAESHPLFALLDAARDGRVLELLHNSEEKFQSLYEGEKGDELAAFAPYLVSLSTGSNLLNSLVAEGWGNSWGVYLTCDKDFERLRRYLRQFLLVTDEEGRTLYFRFYDPRVLRVYLPTCTPEESARMFGSISRYLMEAENPETLLLFTSGEQGATRQELTLLPDGQPSTGQLLTPLPPAVENASPGS
jgi:pSer/pThr/pTyr-binding forkhead associated (FHA) protein